MFRRVFQRNPIKVGMRVRECNSTNKGTVGEVFDKFNDVIWDGTSPMFIKVLLDDGRTLVSNPYKLTRKRAQ